MKYEVSSSSEIQSQRLTVDKLSCLLYTLAANTSKLGIISALICLGSN